MRTVGFDFWSSFPISRACFMLVVRITVPPPTLLITYSSMIIFLSQTFVSDSLIFPMPYSFSKNFVMIGPATHGL